MSAPDYPMTVARDRFGLWLHVTGLSFREVVQVLPEPFAAGALLVFDAEQLDYTASALLDRRRESGRTRDELLADLADLDDNAFWNRRQPLFDNPTCTVWPADCLDEMLLTQGPDGGRFGVCPVEPGVAQELAPDFVYEHPSNVAARLAFYSTGDSVTSVFVTSEDDLLELIRHVVAKALGAPPERSDGLDDIARTLRPQLEAGGVDIRREGEAPAEPSSAPACLATVAFGLWPLGTQWPLLWRRVRAAQIAWDGQRWRLSEPRDVPGRAYVAPIRLLGEIFVGTGRLAGYLVAFGLPIVAAVLIGVFSGWLPGLIALAAAILLWPKFVLGSSWRDLRQHKAAREDYSKKYSL